MMVEILLFYNMEVNIYHSGYHFKKCIWLFTNNESSEINISCNPMCNCNNNHVWGVHNLNYRNYMKEVNRRVTFLEIRTETKYGDFVIVVAFADLQYLMLETTQKLKLADVQIDALRRSMQHAQLTGREITALPPDTKTYESVGRMFLLTDKSEVCQNLQKKSTNCGERIKTLENDKLYMERWLTDTENNLREMAQPNEDMTQCTT